MVLVVVEGSMNSCSCHKKQNKLSLLFYHFLRILQRPVIQKMCARRLLYRIVPQECCAGVVTRNRPNNRNCFNWAIFFLERPQTLVCLFVQIGIESAQCAEQTATVSASVLQQTNLTNSGSYSI